MIQIHCTNCKALLQIDDAFAGGVCRCKYCGAIQTVPKHLKDASTSGVMTMASGARAAKTLYQKKSGTGAEMGSGTGLDDLANLVASSGLSSNRLQKKNAAMVAAAAVPIAVASRSSKLALILSAAGGMVAVALGIVIFQAVRGGNSDKPAPRPNPNPVVGPVEHTVVGPDKPKVALKWKPAAFLGQTLGEKSIVYVIDRGNASSSKLDAVKAALLSSLRSLGPQKKFQVIFWQVNGQIAGYPKEGLVDATPENIAACAKVLDEVVPQGQSQATPAMEKAFKSNPDVICLVAAKTFLEENFASEILKKKGTAKSRVYCFSLGQSELAGPMEKLAKDTKGGYKDISSSDLAAAGRD